MPCTHLGEHGGAVRVGVLRVRECPQVGLARCAVPGPAVELVAETLGGDDRQCMRVLGALPGLDEGQIVWLEWGNDPQFWPAG